MQLFITLDDHFKYLAELVARKPKGVFIASFGIYAGITFDGRDTTTWGERFKLQTRDFLESLRPIPNVRLMIGIPDYKSCRGKIACSHCECGYIYQMTRLLNHGELFSEFKWKVATQAHVKCILFFFEKEILGVAGGRNLNDSNSIDATFQIDSSIGTQLYQQLVPVWKDSHSLTGDAINKILVAQGISEATIDNLMAEFAAEDQMQKMVREVAASAPEE